MIGIDKAPSHQEQENALAAEMQQMRAWIQNKLKREQGRKTANEIREESIRKVTEMAQRGQVSGAVAIPSSHAGADVDVDTEALDSFTQNLESTVIEVEVDASEVEENPEVFKCKVCDREFKRKAALGSHMRVHRK